MVYPDTVFVLKCHNKYKTASLVCCVVNCLVRHRSIVLLKVSFRWSEVYDVVLSVVYICR